MTGKLLTARELADVLGVSTETVLRWTRRGDLPAIRLPGGAIRYREEELEAWLSSRATSTRGVIATESDAAHDRRFSGVRSARLATRPRIAAAAKDEEHD